MKGESDEDAAPSQCPTCEKPLMYITGKFISQQSPLLSTTLDQLFTSKSKEKLEKLTPRQVSDKKKAKTLKDVYKVDTRAGSGGYRIEVKACASGTRN